RLSAVVAERQHEARLVDAVVVLRIDDDVGEVERTHLHVERVVGLAPVLADVVGAIERGLLRLDERVDRRRTRRRNADGDAAELSGRQALRQTLPRFAAVLAAIEAAPRTAGTEEVRLAAEVPHACIKNGGIAGIDADVRAAG